jgi:hypothetical protein
MKLSKNFWLKITFLKVQQLVKNTQQITVGRSARTGEVQPLIQFV